MIINGKYTTQATAYKYGLDLRIADFIESMKDYDKYVVVNKNYVEIFDNETNESMDFAHYIIVTGVDGQKYGNLLLTEMNSHIVVGEDRDAWASTLMDEINISGYPKV